MFAQNSSRSSSPANFTSRQSKQTEDNRNNPFGEVTVLPNSHLVISRISNNGAPVDTSYVIAAFVGDELRGKNKVKRVEGQTYALVLINTITENETVSFKIWKPGSNVLTFDNTLATIPGGTTGSLTSMYQFNMQYTDTDDIIAPQFINELHPAYPNPFNPTTTIKFSLKDNQRASVAVYNIKGQRVTTLVDDMLEKGYHEIVWNSTNAQGKSIGSGIYFIRMTTDNYRKVQKVVLIK